MAWGRPAPVPLTNDKPQEPLTAIHLDGMVVLKIIKHCHEQMPQNVTGSLLGLDVSSVLEVTNSFPYPSSSDVNADEYQIEMMKMLREVNADNNCVGWYQSSTMGSFCTADLVETQFSYQKNLGDKMVVLVYDPLQSSQGSLSIRAFRLTKAFMDAYSVKGAKFTASMLKEKKLDSTKILEEVKVHIKNSPLVKALMYDLKEKKYGGVNSGEQLTLDVNPFVEKSLEVLIGSVSMLTTEQQKFQSIDGENSCLKNPSTEIFFFPLKCAMMNIRLVFLDAAPNPSIDGENSCLKNLSTLFSYLFSVRMKLTSNIVQNRYDREMVYQKKQQAAWLQARRVENAKRKEAGKEPLPEKDPNNSVFKKINEPSRLDALLLSKQVGTYCQQVNNFSGNSFSKLFLAGSFHKSA
eukprot:g6273.t1